eukprot:m.262648 g.262648  ORF g.262648 m.262648 type:complete len:73 (+) comp26802_c0_seq3:2138-2356(+)
MRRPPCVQKCGEVQEWTGSTSYGACPPNNTHDRFNSLVAEIGSDAYLKRFREFVVYSGDQCYPEYLIEYVRR